MSGRFALLLSTWFGCGYFPFAPGTAGSIGGLIIALTLHRYAATPAWMFTPLAVLLFLPAVWAASRTELVTGRHDPGIVVVDEVVGQWITLSAAPSWDWPWILAAFLLFRLFDIWKPFPVRRLESLPSGWGVVSDDAAAGLYGALVLYIGTSLQFI